MPPRRAGASRARRAPAIASIAVLLGMAAPAAAQAPAVRPKAASGNQVAPPAAPGPSPQPASASPAPPGASPAPPGASPAPPGASPAPPGAGASPAPPGGDSATSPGVSQTPPDASLAPPGGAQMPVPHGYYLPPPLPPWANPRTIEYVEGDPVPRGYGFKTRADRTLVGAGLVTFGVPYALSFTVASIATLGDEDFDEFGPLFIPFVGPMIAATTLEGAEGAAMFWLTMDAVAQVGGLLLYVAGFAHEEVYLQRQFAVGARGAEATSLRAPTLSIGASSAELRWRF
ncbi:hypothetical protein [Sorangium sp. So ce1389]|uniref:hypothetical protein n=1 Tax=Sorangium sp. So ce1389 TaxID=3133336 RepID=UPI003F60485F